MTSGHEQGEPAGARPRLRLSVPSLSIARLSSPLSSPKKEKQKAPSFGRGGLGNIRTAKSQQFEPGTSAFPSSLEPSPLFSSKSASEAGSSGASLRSVSTGFDKRASTSTTRSKLSSNRSTGCLVPGDVFVSNYGNHGGETTSELGSPISPSFRSEPRESMFSTNSVNTFGIPRVPKSPASTGSKSTTRGGRSDTSSEYVRELVLDAAVRAEGKRLLSVNRDANGPTGGVNSKPVERVRTGRGGAGAYTKVNKDVDACLFPTTAALTREHELRLAAQERQILEASRARAAVVRRTGRGGVGNFSNTKGKRKQVQHEGGAVDKKTSKATGRRRQNENRDHENDPVKHEGLLEHQHRGHRRSGSVSSTAESISRRRSVRAKSTVRIQRKGLGRLWSHVTNVRAKGHLSKSIAPVEFEIVELKPETEYDDEAGSPTSPNPDAITYDAPIFGSTNANREFALARLERRSQRTRLGEVPEEEAWVDEVGTNTRLGDVVPKGGGNRYAMTSAEPMHQKILEGDVLGASDEFRSESKREIFSRGAKSARHNISALPRASVSRDSVGTFGPRRGPVAYEEHNEHADLSDAESIVDPYMHDG